MHFSCEVTVYKTTQLHSAYSDSGRGVAPWPPKRVFDRMVFWHTY